MCFILFSERLHSFKQNGKIQELLSLLIHQSSRSVFPHTFNMLKAMTTLVICTRSHSENGAIFLGSTYGVNPGLSTSFMLTWPPKETRGWDEG